MDIIALIRLLLLIILNGLAALWLIKIFATSLIPSTKNVELTWLNIAITLFSAAMLTISLPLFVVSEQVAGIQNIYNAAGMLMFGTGLWALRGTLFEVTEQSSSWLKHSPSFVGIVLLLLAILVWINPIGR